MNRFILLFVFSILFTSCAAVTKTEIVDKPIPFDNERKSLTLGYLKSHYNIEQNEPTIHPKMIVLHWTAIPTLEKSFQAFAPVRLPNWRPDIKSGGALNVSAQFLVDRDGTIYRLLPETTMARHVIGLNYCAIGLENVGGTPETPLTKAQLMANIRLVKYLKEKYPGIEYLIGHYEYTLFENTPLWKEKDPGYRTKKTDPGVNFMKTVRKKTSKHHWKPIPKPSKK